MHAKKIILLAIFLLGLGAFFYFDLGNYFSLQSLQQNRADLRAYTQAHYAFAAAAFVALYVLQTMFSLPGGALMSLAGGFLFGSVFGTLFIAVGATAGATLAFLAARYVLRDWIENKFGARLEPIQIGFANNAFNYLLTLRLIPLFPFFLINLVAGLTRMKITTYILATGIGILPGSFVFAFAGQQLGSISSLHEIASAPVLLAFTLLGLLALLPIAYKKWVSRGNS